MQAGPDDASWPDGRREGRLSPYRSLLRRLPRSWSTVACRRATRKHARDWWRWTTGSLSGSKEPSSPHPQPLLALSPSPPAKAKWSHQSDWCLKLLLARQHFETVVHGFFTSLLDYSHLVSQWVIPCMSPLGPEYSSSLDWNVQEHWLPVPLKIAALLYFSVLLHSCAPARCFRSADQMLLEILRSKVRLEIELFL